MQNLLRCLVGSSQKLRQVSDVILQLVVNRHPRVGGLVDVGLDRKIVAFELGQAQEIERRLKTMKNSQNSWRSTELSGAAVLD